MMWVLNSDLENDPFYKYSYAGHKKFLEGHYGIAKPIEAVVLDGIPHILKHVVLQPNADFDGAVYLDRKLFKPAVLDKTLRDYA